MTYEESRLQEYLRKKLDSGVAEHLGSAFPLGEGAVSFYIRPIPPIRPITVLGDHSEEDFILLTFDYPDDDGEAIVPPDCEFE